MATFGCFLFFSHYIHGPLTTLYSCSLPWQGLKAGTKKQKYEKISEKKVSTSIEVTFLHAMLFVAIDHMFSTMKLTGKFSVSALGLMSWLSYGICILFPLLPLTSV